MRSLGIILLLAAGIMGRPHPPHAVANASERQRAAIDSIPDSVLEV